MPITSAPKQPSTYALWREVQDVSNRTRLGSLYYLLAWLLTWGFSQVPLQHLLLGLGGCGFFSVRGFANAISRRFKVSSKNCGIFTSLKQMNSI